MITQINTRICFILKSFRELNQERSMVIRVLNCSGVTWEKKWNSSPS